MGKEALIELIAWHLRQLAPHQKERDGVVLLTEAAEELNEKYTRQREATAELATIIRQRDWLLTVLWKAANHLNNSQVHAKLSAIGHEHCEACGGSGLVEDGKLCAFGDEQVRRIKGL